MECIWDLVTIGCRAVGGGGLGVALMERVLVWDRVSIGCMGMDGGIRLGDGEIGWMVRGIVPEELLEVAEVEGRLEDNCDDGKVRVGRSSWDVGEECVGGGDEAETND